MSSWQSQPWKTKAPKQPVTSRQNLPLPRNSEQAAARPVIHCVGDLNLGVIIGWGALFVTFVGSAAHDVGWSLFFGSCGSPALSPWLARSLTSRRNCSVGQEPESDCRRAPALLAGAALAGVPGMVNDPFAWVLSGR